jgi:hypothetical protein
VARLRAEFAESVATQFAGSPLASAILACTGGTECVRNGDGQAQSSSPLTSAREGAPMLKSGRSKGLHKMTNVLVESTQQNHHLKGGHMSSTLAIDSATQPIQQRSMDREIDPRSWLRQEVEKLKKAVLLLSPLLLAATMAAAQAAPNSHFTAAPANTSSAMAGQTASAQSDSLRGCLTGSKGIYTLTDHQGKQHKVVGDNHALWDEVGHEVDLTGKPGSGDASSTFQESEISDIASRCWNFTLNWSDVVDRVALFTEGLDRFFARSEAIIGWKVQHCHPPGSVETVDQILNLKTAVDLEA